MQSPPCKFFVKFPPFPLPSAPLLQQRKNHRWKDLRLVVLPAISAERGTFAPLKNASPVTAVTGEAKALRDGSLFLILFYSAAPRSHLAIISSRSPRFRMQIRWNQAWTPSCIPVSSQPMIKPKHIHFK